jgi:electron transport complex protein RnfB
VARGRDARIDTRERPAGWKRPPLQINADTCINCDACIRHCPSSLGAVFSRGFTELFIVPELCSGCGLCAQACPVDSIHERPGWTESAAADWGLPGSHDDPYTLR